MRQHAQLVDARKLSDNISEFEEANAAQLQYMTCWSGITEKIVVTAQIVMHLISYFLLRFMYDRNACAELSIVISKSKFCLYILRLYDISSHHQLLFLLEV